MPVSRAVFNVDNDSNPLDKTVLRYYVFYRGLLEPKEVYKFSNAGDFWIHSCHIILWMATIFYELCHDNQALKIMVDCMKNIESNDPFYLIKNLELLKPLINVNKVKGKKLILNFSFRLPNMQSSIYKYNFPMFYSYYYELYFFTFLFAFLQNSHPLAKEIMSKSISALWSYHKTYSMNDLKTGTIAATKAIEAGFTAIPGMDELMKTFNTKDLN